MAARVGGLLTRATWQGSNWPATREARRSGPGPGPCWERDLALLEQLPPAVPRHGLEAIVARNVAALVAARSAAPR